MYIYVHNVYTLHNTRFCYRKVTITLRCKIHSSTEVFFNNIIPGCIPEIKIRMK